MTTRYTTALELKSLFWVSRGDTSYHDVETHAYKLIAPMLRELADQLEELDQKFESTSKSKG